MPELETLCTDFPLTFERRQGSGEPFNYGFECGPGWYAIIRSLAELIEPKLRELGPQDYQYLGQCKEKFGALRFYVNAQLGQDVSDAIRAAEDESCRTCEECGESGRRLSDGGWIRTRCQGHASR